MPAFDKSPQTGSPQDGSRQDSRQDMAAVIARARWLMLIAAATTAIAVAAVAAVIGYRFYSANRTLAGRITTGTVFLPQGAHVVSTTVSGGRIIVTFELAGVSEVRIFDVKTLQQIGQLHFATEH